MQSMATVRFPSGESALPQGHGDTDALLVANVQRDPAAFAELYRQYLDPIYGYCWRRLGSREAAEDATSQIFLKALGALPQYRGDHSFRSWLFTIAHNVVVDHYRAHHPNRPWTMQCTSLTMRSPLKTWPLQLRMRRPCARCSAA